MLDTLAPSGLALAVSDRALGNLSLLVDDQPSAVLTRRTALARWLGFAVEDVVCAEQVHGARVVRVGASERGTRVPGADGLITDRPGVLLLLLFADCVPVSLFDPDRPAVGIVHAGWKGTASRIAAAGVAAMVAAFGSRPERLRAAIGPSIGGCCYEVGDEVAAAIERSAPRAGAARPVVRPGERGRPRADLAAANRAQLLEVGLRPESVELAGICTACRVDRYFSHRAEDGRAGRFGAAIGLLA